MKTILTLPDGSAFDASFVVGITWDKSRSAQTPACIRVYAAQESMSLFSSRPNITQIHYCPMENDDAARAACDALVAAWSGRLMQPTEAH